MFIVFEGIDGKHAAKIELASLALGEMKVA
jgi:hypothetical protein